MKIILSAISAMCLSAATGLAAAGGSSYEEAVPMAYLSIPLGGSGGGLQQTSFGVGLARADYERNAGFNFMSNGKPRIVDVSFRGNELDALSFNGINTLQQKLIHNADGTTTTSTFINPNILIPAVVVGAIICVEVCDDNDTAPQPIPQ